MLVFILRLLGLTPEKSGKTGSREAAWLLLLIVCVFQAGAMWLGTEMVSATMPVMVVLWPAGITALAGAYKLKYDRRLLEAGLKKGEAPTSPPPDYYEHPMAGAGIDSA
ncbi:MAG: hypothetical protein AAGG69_00580 [Pseudomonadota bacterium]